MSSASFLEKKIFKKLFWNLMGSFLPENRKVSSAEASVGFSYSARSIG